MQVLRFTFGRPVFSDDGIQRFHVGMPAGAKVLRVAVLKTLGETEAFLWALVDPAAPRETRSITVYRTGVSLHWQDVGPYIGSFEWGDWLLHVFDGGAVQPVSAHHG